MLEALRDQLQAEAEKLRHELNVTLPAEIRRAVEMGDLRENSEYKAALERQRLVQARLGQLGERLAKLSSVDLKQIPTDRVGLGSHVVVLDLEQDVRETYHLVIGDADEFVEGHVTMSSPIGRSLVDKAVGDEVVLKLPARTRRLRIVALTTIHESGA
jgi:transcription elongation factor GreA